MLGNVTIYQLSAGIRSGMGPTAVKISKISLLVEYRSYVNIFASSLARTTRFVAKNLETLQAIRTNSVVARQGNSKILPGL
jgi:hypothetical protein